MMRNVFPILSFKNWTLNLMLKLTIFHTSSQNYLKLLRWSTRQFLSQQSQSKRIIISKMSKSIDPWTSKWFKNSNKLWKSSKSFRTVRKQMLKDWLWINHKLLQQQLPPNLEMAKRWDHQWVLAHFNQVLVLPIVTLMQLKALLGQTKLGVRLELKERQNWLKRKQNRRLLKNHKL